MVDLRIALCCPNGIDIKSTPGYQSAIKIKGTEIVTVQGAGIGRNRNELITRSHEKIQTEFDFRHILFVDIDVEFTQKHVDRLLDHDLPIVSGMYERRDNPGCCHAGYWEDYTPGFSGYCIPYTNTGLASIDWFGCGFVLINSDVFKKMTHPYFRHVMVEYEGLQKETSPDWGFCIEARNAGFELYLDCDCRVKHVNLNERGVMQNQGVSAESLCFMAREKLDSAYNDIKKALFDTIQINNQLRQEKDMLKKENEKLKGAEKEKKK